MQITFWHMQMFPDNNPEFACQIPSILQHHSIIGMGDRDDNGQIDNFIHRMQVNDIVALKRGKRLIALTQIIGGAYSVPEKGDGNALDWIVYRRPIRVLDWALDNEELPHPRGTLNICSNDDVATTQLIKRWFEKVRVSFEDRELSMFV